MAAIVVVTAWISTSSAASIYATGPFKYLCSSIEISAEPDVYTRFGRAGVNEIAARTMEEHLRSRGLDYPVVAGAACLRERATAPQQFSILFYARVVPDPENPRRLAVSLIMHSFSIDRHSPGPYHTDIPRAHHEFPTEVSFCPADADPTQFLADRVIEYFDATMLKIIEAQPAAKGGRR